MAENTRKQTDNILNHNLTAKDFQSVPEQQRLGEIDALINKTLLSTDIVRIRVWNREGLIIYSDNTSIVGQQFKINENLQSALDGRLAPEISALERDENVGEREQYERLFEVHAPIQRKGSEWVIGAYEVYYDMQALTPRLNTIQFRVWSGVGVGFLGLYTTLFFLIRNASRQLIQRNEENSRLLVAERQQRRLAEKLERVSLALSENLDLRDRETEGHTQRVTEMTLRLAKKLGFSDQQLVHVRRGALLHDIGKMGIPDQILLKNTALSDEEWTIMRKHPTFAYELMRRIAYLSEALNIPHFHHEWWDGSGYPCGLRGEQIPLEARVFAVVDVWDAVTSDRPYRKAWPFEQALAYIRERSANQFDPKVVEGFLQMLAVTDPSQ